MIEGRFANRPTIELSLVTAVRQERLAFGATSLGGPKDTIGLILYAFEDR